MATNMVLLKSLTHNTRNVGYELLVYLAPEAGECRIYVERDGVEVGEVIAASLRVVRDPNSTLVSEIVEGLISATIAAINKNESSVY